MADLTQSLDDRITQALESAAGQSRRQALLSCSHTLYHALPVDVDAFVEECDGLVTTGSWRNFWLVTLWIKRKRTAYALKYFPVYQRWLLEHIHSWGACDVFCYRVLNPLLEEFPQLFASALEWARADQLYVRRAAAVCLIQSTRHSFRVNVPFEKVETICELLKSDPHPHIQKAVGWLLKYALLSYPEQVKAYLRDNLPTLSRTTFRYALEMMDPPTRDEFMRLRA
jgi:3-methyladenine DNA glycosylase AlkD